MNLWFGIVLINVLWALNPIFVGKLVSEVGPEHAAFLRYFTAFISIFIYKLFSIVCFRRTSHFSESRIPPVNLFLVNGSRRDWGFVLLMGIGTAFLSPLFQSLGYLKSTSTHNVLLVSLEPAITLLFALIFLRERLSLKQLLGIGLAALGLFYFLNLQSGGEISFSGDLFFCLAFCGEAIFSVCAKKINPKHKSLELYGSALFLGLGVMGLYLWSGEFGAGVDAGLGSGLSRSFFHGLTYPLFPQTLYGWISVLYLGAIGSAATYLFWLHCLSKNIAVSKMAMSLFIQPITGALIGIFFFHESLLFTQWIGVLILMMSVWFSI